MQIPSYGAAPLSTTFLIVRVMELIAMVIIVGLTANFVNEMTGGGIEPPSEIVGTLSVTSIAALYCLISIPFYMGPANIGLFVMTAIDSLLLLAFIVVAVTVGKPLSFMNCYMVKNTDTTADAQSAYNLVTSLASTIKSGGKLSLWTWAGATKANCFETKTIWGLSIALCILFTTSMILLPTLFFKQKKAGGPPKDAA